MKGWLVLLMMCTLLPSAYAAFGNSDGDLPMLQWSCSGSGVRLCAYIHHTDAKRKWANDQDSHIGRLEQGLAAAEYGWSVVDMRREWKRVFAFEAIDR